MKKLVFILLAMVLSLIAYAQQPITNEFWGLKLGEVYSLDQITEHVGENGTFDKDLGNIDIGSGVYRAYSFSNVNFNDEVVPSFIFLTLAHGTLGGVAIPYTLNNIPEGQPLDNIYEKWRQVLTEKYENLIEFPIEGHPEVKRLLYMQGGVALRLDKWMSEDITTEVEVSYLSLLASFSDAMLDFKRPTIQDSFFGMKMGSIQSVSSLKQTLSHKGVFLEEQYDSSGKNISFTKLIFAGKTWDYGNFKLSDRGELYWISAYDSLNDGYSYDDEKKEADRIYNTYKERLDSKYGEHEETETDNGKYVIYSGDNDMAIILSNERSKSQGGSYRRYVKIEYIQTSIYGRLSENSNDEL